MNETVPSPCISVCLLDTNDVCVGCYRTADEITEWMTCDDAQKEEILKVCIERRKADQSIQLK